MSMSGGGAHSVTSSTGGVPSQGHPGDARDTGVPNNTAGTVGPESYRSAGSGDDRSLGDILGDIATNLTTLVRQEIELAKTEAKTQVSDAASKAGKGAGMLAGAGVAGHLALVFASLALMFLLDSWMHTGWAALIVMALWAIVAGVLAATGRKELKQVSPPNLETTQRTLKEDKEWAKEQKSS